MFLKGKLAVHWTFSFFLSNSVEPVGKLRQCWTRGETGQAVQVGSSPRVVGGLLQVRSVCASSFYEMLIEQRRGWEEKPLTSMRLHFQEVQVQTLKEKSIQQLLSSNNEEYTTNHGERWVENKAEPKEDAIHVCTKMMMITKAIAINGLISDPQNGRRRLWTCANGWKINCPSSEKEARTEECMIGCLWMQQQLWVTSNSYL